MISEGDAIAALGIGLAGAGHCLGMCGGIAAAVNLGGYRGTGTTVAYHLGRLLSYTALGALLAGLASSINLAQWTLALRYIAALLLIAMGLSIAGWWQGIAVLERLGSRLWAPVQRLSRHILPIRHPRQALFLGLCWGLMPCGLIYSALAWASTTGSAMNGALVMLLFGAGTLPAMVATSFGAGGVQALLRRRGLKLFIALFLIVSGAWNLTMTYRHGGHLLRPVGGSGGMSMPAMEHGRH